MKLLGVEAFIILLHSVSSKHHKESEILPCPKVEPFEEFNATRFSGLWFEAFANPFLLTLYGRCVVYSFTFNQNRVLTTYIKYQSYNWQVRRILGSGRFVSPSTFIINFPAACKLLPLNDQLKASIVF